MFCSHSHHLCHRERVQGHDYCINHILDDKSAPFKQCNFMLKGQKRCHRASPKTDKKDGYVPVHCLTSNKLCMNEITSRLTYSDEN